MEHRLRLRLAIAVTCATAILLFAVHRRRRRRNARKTACYLAFETKPQSSFKRVLADNSYSPFKHFKGANSDSVDAKSTNLHPYEADIMTLVKSVKVDYSFLDKISLTSMCESYVWVETEPQLRELVDVLSKEKVFAVDTEQHSLRSFLGFTALIQISTQKEDYLIDTIALHDVMDMIQPVFSDPNVLKVFHGADNDVLWLQRDFHIYVVNLFDTAKACEVLSKPQKSLAYLLETYCGVITNKLFQREDWRQRPLPEEMLEYAQSDAHYLLYIARCLLDELRERGNACQDDKLNFLLEASRRSNTTCLQLYAKEDETFPGEYIASSILSRNLSSQGIDSSKFLEAKFQNNVRKLCAWRDLMARVHDESLRYVLSDQAIVSLADKSPATETEIYGIISEADQNNDSPASLIFESPSPVVCSHWEDIPCLLKDGGGTSDDILQKLLLKHLGPSGTCSLSIYNYSLLSKLNLKLENRSISKANGLKNRKPFGRKASRELFVKKFSCKAPVYHNCRIYASDGRLLCYCDRRKLEWYLSRSLAKLVDENPPAIMLLFEPKGRPEDEDNDFYIQSKRNMCVGCGERNHYLRYRIIPSCYRVHFPEHLKSHRSHDIVLLCVDCHEVAHAAAEKYKRQVAAEFGIPLYVRKVVDPGQKQATEASELHANDEAGVSPLQLRTAAMALLRHGTRMPSKRRQELLEIVKTYYGGRDITYQDLEAALLVGMSPHERRKFEKKRALSDDHSGASIFAGLVLDVNSDSKTVNGSATRAVDTNDQASSSEEPVNKLEMDVQSPPLPSELEVQEKARATDDSPEAFSSGENGELKDTTLSDAESNHESSNPPNGTPNLCAPNTDGRKHNSKLSLLGHGPHGKEVVAYLLEKQGEDGIREFCQKWRQVFVDALHPRFLPGGWDIKHSGKRDFGEFSVYNPTKKPGGAI